MQAQVWTKTLTGSLHPDFLVPVTGTSGFKCNSLTPMHLPFGAGGQGSWALKPNGRHNFEGGSLCSHLAVILLGSQLRF